MLVAEVDERIVAAVPLAGGRAIADPFRPTADIVELLAGPRRAGLAGPPARPRRASACRAFASPERCLRPVAGRACWILRAWPRG